MNDANDAVLLRCQRQFLHEVEQSIRESNREIIHDRIPELNTESFVRFATVVAGLRAEYLQAALAVGRGTEPADPAGVVESLRSHREAYEEARDAFEALQRAIERGYVDIAGSAPALAAGA